MNCGGHLIKLIRTKAGRFSVEKSVPLDNINVETNLINPLEVLNLPQIVIDSAAHEKVLHGQQINNPSQCADFVILIYNNSISAVGVADKNKITVKKVFS